MKYTYFGKTGIQVSRLSFGTMTFGAEADETTSEMLYKRCREAGINLFDCANIYQAGKSEEILGKLIKAERQNVIITSKAYFPTAQDINAKGLSRKHIRETVEQSLKRLDTDYIDIYFMHHFDDKTPLEETLSTLNDLVHQGKILYIGISNFSAWQTMKALNVAEKNHFASIQCIQPMYNLVKRQAEVEILPMALSENLAVMSYNPLAAGLLSGKYSNGDELSEGRIKQNKMYKLRYGDPKVHEIAHRFTEFAKHKGYSPVALAIAWTLHHPAITSPLLGARNVEQLEESLKAIDIVMDDELYQGMTALSVQPAPATDRNDELKTSHIAAK